jgi:preprotein translocase subunit SecF
MTDKDDRLTMPGQAPTDEDLRLDAELTRQELAQTVSALGQKADVKARVRETAHEKAEQLREVANEKTEQLRVRGDELVEKLPDPVAEKVRPVVTSATRKPMVSLAVLLAFILVLRRIRRRRAS